MQILNVVVYSHHGDMREIPFKPNSVNIVTGPDNSGKSSIGKIIEYCLGAEHHMAIDHPSNRVSWYGIRIRLKDQEYFIARKHPKIPPSNLTMYFKTGKPVQIPKYIEHPTTTQETVIQRLSDEIGILPHIQIPWPSFENQSEAVITNTLPFCFQYQAEIESDLFLFHNYFGEFTKTITKYTLPYFLGAIPNSKVKQRYQLIKLNKEIKSLENQLDELRVMKKSGNRLSKNLIIESKKLRMINDAEIKMQENEIDSILTLIAEWTPLKNKHELHDDLIQLQDQSSKLRETLSKIDKEIDIAKKFKNEYFDHKTSLEHQKSHLQPIDLFEKLNGEAKKCPLCSNYLENDNDIVTAIKTSLLELNSNIDDIQNQTISASSILENLEKKQVTVLQQLTENHIEMELLLEREYRNKQNVNDDMNRARLSAKAELMLNILNKEENIDLKQEIIDKQFLKNEIDKDVDLISIEKNIDKIHNEINQFINKKTKEWGLKIKDEYVSFNTRNQKFWHLENDISKQLYAGGESWLALHIITMLGFHKHFHNYERPVPNFLFLDQPSQVYFSSAPHDYDEGKVNTMFNFLFNIEKEQFVQLIIIEHATLKGNLEYTSHIVKHFTENKKFIPDEWPTLDQIQYNSTNRG